MPYICAECGSEDVWECRWVKMNDQKESREGPNDYCWCDSCDNECHVVFQEEDTDPGEMDGDHESALTSAGFGTDESYGGERDEE